MSENPPDSHEGYTASDGRYVETPPLRELPDGDVDLERWREPARRSAREAAERSYSRPFSHINHMLDAVGNPFQKHIEASMAHLRVRDVRRAEDILMAARRKREETADAAADALIDALATPEGAGRFRSLLADVVGFGPVSYANGYATYMEHENPWVMPLLAALPPARLAPALGSLVPHYVFDPYRTWFHEPALEAFLHGPHSDLRHLEGDHPARDPVKSEPIFDFRAFMAGDMSVGEVLKNANQFRRTARAARGDGKEEAREMSQMLGVDVSPSDIDDMGVVATDLRRELKEKRLAAVPMPAGAFLVSALRGQLTPRAAAIPPDVWASYVATHLERLDRALGLEKGPGKGFAYEVKRTTAMMRYLPATPKRHVDALFRVALGKKKSGRADAQRLLRGTPGLLKRLAKEGAKRALDTRLQAAACLGYSGDKGAVPVLEEMLRSETSRIGQNACLTALQRLGADVAAHAPDQAALITEAEAVFDAPYPETQHWLADVDLPDLTFTDGTSAPVTLGPWLLRLAAELGLPEGGPLLDLRLDALARDSRRALGQTALTAFVGRDTLRWEDLQSPAERQRLLARMYEEYVELFDWETGWLRQHDPERAKRRREKLSWERFRDSRSDAHIAEFLRQKRNWEPYLHSANDAKGILGLARCLTPGAVKKVLRGYLGPHARRTAQAKAVMSLYASFGGGAVIAELSRIATEQPQKGLRAHAVDCLENLGVTFHPPDAEPDTVVEGPDRKK